MKKWLCSGLLLAIFLGACACQHKDIDVNVYEKPAPIEKSNADIGMREEKEQEAQDLLTTKKQKATAIRKHIALIKSFGKYNDRSIQEAINDCETVLSPMLTTIENEDSNTEICIDVVAKGIEAVKKLRSINKVPNEFIDPLLQTLLSTKDALDVAKIESSINESFASIGSANLPENQADKRAESDNESKNEKDNKVTLPSGLEYSITKEGQGEKAANGMTATVHYDGYLLGGVKFDSSRDRDETFSFKLGDDQVIEGWEEGVKGMKIGEIRHLVIPPELGYGEIGSGPIPGGATLIFDIELLKLSK